MFSIPTWILTDGDTGFSDPIELAEPYPYAS